MLCEVLVGHVVDDRGAEIVEHRPLRVAFWRRGVAGGGRLQRAAGVEDRLAGRRLGLGLGPGRLGGGGFVAHHGLASAVVERRAGGLDRRPLLVVFREHVVQGVTGRFGGRQQVITSATGRIRSYTRRGMATVPPGVAPVAPYSARILGPLPKHSQSME